jgi:serpin B
VAAVETSLNQFALDLYRTISADNSQAEDEAISPFSIAAALAMTYAGASGETASQLAQALHIDLPPDRFQAAMETILQDVLPGGQSNAPELDIGNALWGQSGFPILDSFRQLLQNRYGAGFQEADFLHAPDQATKAINDWVNTQTHDMIPKLFDTLSRDTRLVLANALYFKANWATAFDAGSTERMAFHLASGSSLDVSMMRNTSHFAYTETSDYQIAELPYEGRRYSMVILLPKAARADLAANFSAADLQTWLGRMQSTDLDVALPKFKLDTSMSLVDTLASLGVTDAFDQNLADFSGIDGSRDLYVSQAVHKAVVEVDETGTKAAAATGIAVTTASQAVHMPETPVPFYADHPFHFLILDRQTNSILFEGQVQQPTPYDGTDNVTQDLPTGPASNEPLPPPGLIVFPGRSNHANRYDVNADGIENQLDALLVINYVNNHLTEPTTSQSAALLSASFYPDVDGDGQIVPLDALLLINRLNDNLSQAALQGEGESAAASDASTSAAAVDLVLGLDALAAPDSIAVGQPGSRPSARRA